ncbi:MAG: aldehyde dehydrogenase family protein [Alphaproteobacteria bacterium]
MAEHLKCLSPIDGSVYVERPLAGEAEIASALKKAQQAEPKWRAISVAERAEVCSRAVDAFVRKGPSIAEEITRQMGRPLSQSPGEVRGFEERARYMIGIAEETLMDRSLGPKEGFNRFIRREPVGVVFVIAPWNYPYLTAVNVIIPAIMAGNTVILKHSAQTPLCAERYAEAFVEAGLPEGVFQYLHLSHANAERMMKAPEVNFVAFTGSVPGGKTVEKATAGRFIGVGLELGGKDPAYVHPDCNLDHAIENLVDGAFFNSGQSCCGIERIYVHEQVYNKFLTGYVDLVNGYRLGNPLDLKVNLGPVVKPSAARLIEEQVGEAVKKGAKTLIDPKKFPEAKSGTCYLAPQVVVNVDHSMRLMTEESFGPVIGIMKVKSDDEAIHLMNDSDYGLTAAIWTEDQDTAIRIGDQVATGTWFMNRCDYLDPALAWVGIKDSGRGCTLSADGYLHLTRPKSFHLRIKT